MWGSVSKRAPLVASLRALARGSSQPCIQSGAVSSSLPSSQLPGAIGLIQAHRHFAESATQAQEDPLKKIFFNMMKKYRTFVDELTTTKITLDPDDPKAVSSYKSLMDGIRKKVGAPSKTESLAMILDKEAKAAPDVKTFFKLLPKLKAKMGVTEEYAGDKMMLEAVEKVEKKIGRVLVRTDKEGMSLLKKEFQAINKALNVDPKMLKDLQTEIETECAKAELQTMKSEVVETIDTHKKSFGLEDIQVDLKVLDHRKHL